MVASHSESEEVSELVGNTGFSLDQIQWLKWSYKQLRGDQPTIPKEDLYKVPDLEFNLMRSRIHHAFFGNRNLGKRSICLAHKINFEHFLTQHVVLLTNPHHQGERAGIAMLERKAEISVLHVCNVHCGTIENVVKEVLRNCHKEKDSAHCIADRAMMEVASICMEQKEHDQV